jgi:hypothetical protein
MAKRKRNGIYCEYEDDYALIPRGKLYKPYVTIQDVASDGRSTRLHSVKTGRQHDFLSDLERNYFWTLEYCDDVVDIREQFPMALDETLLIADELGLKHPINTKTKEPIVMTSDFCITVKGGTFGKDVIRTAKYKKDLLDRRVMEKFAIEQTYWQRKGLDWGIITEDEVNKTYSLNVADIMYYYSLTDNAGFNKINSEELEDIIIAFIQRLIDGKFTIRQYASQIERDLHLPKGAGIALFKHLLARKYIHIDLFSPMDLDQSIQIELLKKSIEIGDVVV